MTRRNSVYWIEVWSKYVYKLRLNCDKTSMVPFLSIFRSPTHSLYHDEDQLIYKHRTIKSLVNGKLWWKPHPYEICFYFPQWNSLACETRKCANERLHTKYSQRYEKIRFEKWGNYDKCAIYIANNFENKWQLFRKHVKLRILNKQFATNGTYFSSSSSAIDVWFVDVVVVRCVCFCCCCFFSGKTIKQQLSFEDYKMNMYWMRNAHTKQK